MTRLLSDFKVEVIQIAQIEPHTNADSLSIVNVHGGYPCIIRTDDFKAGDLAIYVPVDAIVPVSNPLFHFLRKREDQIQHRVKASKLRGVFSMGLLVPASAKMREGDDVQEMLGITKYDPEVTLAEFSRLGQREHDPGYMPTFGVESLRRYRTFDEGELVQVTEKLHGTSFSAVWRDDRLYVRSHKVMRAAPRVVTPADEREYKWDLAAFKLRNCAWKLCRIFGMSAPVRPRKPHNVGLDIFWRVAQHYDLADLLKLRPNMAIYGEIYGPVQKGFPYDAFDLTFDGQLWPALAIFDVKDTVTDEWLSVTDAQDFCDDLGLRMVPVLAGRIPFSLARIKELSDGKSLLNPKHIREGCVVRRLGAERKIAKYVGDDYLLQQGKA